MLSNLLQLDRPTVEPALITVSEEISWAELSERVGREQRQLRPIVQQQRIGMLFSPTIDAMVRLIALSSLECHVFLLADDTPGAFTQMWATEFEWSCVIPAGTDKPLPEATQGKKADEPAVTILTSGTTGKPKAVEHSWNSLARPVRRMTLSNPRWLLTFRPHLYAGLQVILQCLVNRGAPVLPSTGATAHDVVTLAAKSQVEYASATPSYWRWLLTMAQTSLLASIPLRQITLGGEAVDQSILDALHRIFPQTRLVHIYATTELGRCFSVTDGRAGFPATFLNEPSLDGVEMRIEDGELVVKSANAMRRYGGEDKDSRGNEWFHTGDLVSQQGERVYFVGRTTDMINVGGNKVHPIEIETVIRQVPGVADARVYGTSSSLVGQLVACDIVVAAGCEGAEVEQAVRETTVATLSSFQRPRLITIVDEIPRTSAGKARRE